MNLKAYVSTYKKYNDGNLGGDWFTIAPDTDLEIFIQEIKDFHKDENDWEFMFQDWDSETAELVGFLEKCGLLGETPDLEAIIEALEALEGISYDLAVYNAYASNCGYDSDVSDLISKCDESYAGEFNSDSDFAEDMAEQVGAIDKTATWPQTCIDWDHAARELMYDYFESDGYYFRNL